jgi:cellulose synthase/poly-beta-1,6-N-acetylglucosamine synthase-like glycosyltransferase
VSPVEAILAAVLGVVWLFWALSAVYLLILALGAAAAHRGSVQSSDTKRRFCFLIPAHNEELNLGAVVEGLGKLDYPAERFTVVVIADNCTDKTADIAREQGAEVLERSNQELRGKGYALEWALSPLLADPRRFDAFVILDADSFLSPSFLQVMNSAIDRGHRALQGFYGVLNVDESWRTRLMAVALALAHYVKPMGRRRFGLSDGLKGNGMCFTREVLEQVPWSGESITEDIEYTLRLVEAGVKIEFLPEAVVNAQMPTTGKQASSQRQRWEGGRYALLKRAAKLFGRSVARGRFMVADRAAELIIPPFVELFALPAVCLAGSFVWKAYAPGSVVAKWMVRGWSGLLVVELLYLGLGLIIARVPLRVASALLFAPFYIVWKFGVYGAMALRRGVGGWNRTERRTL